MVTRVLKSSPLDYPTISEEFLQKAYKELNTKENNCDDRFFYLCTKVEHNGEYHYFTFSYDRWLD